jgi:hypothetical protein
VSHEYQVSHPLQGLPQAICPNYKGVFNELQACIFANNKRVIKCGAADFGSDVGPELVVHLVLLVAVRVVVLQVADALIDVAVEVQPA